MRVCACVFACVHANIYIKTDNISLMENPITGWLIAFIIVRISVIGITRPTGMLFMEKTATETSQRLLAHKSACSYFEWNARNSSVDARAGPRGYSQTSRSKYHPSLVVLSVTDTQHLVSSPSEVWLSFRPQFRLIWPISVHEIRPPQKRQHQYSCTIKYTDWVADEAINMTPSYRNALIKPDIVRLR